MKQAGAALICAAFIALFVGGVVLVFWPLQAQKRIARWQRWPFEAGRRFVEKPWYPRYLRLSGILMAAAGAWFVGSVIRRLLAR